MFPNWETHAPQLRNTCTPIGKHMHRNWETCAPQLRNMMWMPAFRYYGMLSINSMNAFL